MWSNIAERDGTARGLLNAFAETGLSAVMLDRFCGEFVRADVTPVSHPAITRVLW